MQQETQNSFFLNFKVDSFFNYKKNKLILLSSLITISIIWILVFYDFFNLFKSNSYSFCETVSIWFSSFLNWLSTLFFLSSFIFIKFNILFFLKRKQKNNSINVYIFLNWFLSVYSMFSILFYLSLKLDPNNILIINSVSNIHLNIEYIFIPLLINFYFFININFIKMESKIKKFLYNSIFVLILPLFYLFYSMLCFVFFKNNIDSYSRILNTYNVFQIIFFSILFLVSIFLIATLYNFIFKKYINNNFIKQTVSLKEKKYLLGWNISYISSLLSICFLMIFILMFWFNIHFNKPSITAFALSRILVIIFFFLLIGNFINLKIYRFQNRNNKNIIFIYILFSILFGNILGVIGSIFILKNNNILEVTKNASSFKNANI